MSVTFACYYPGEDPLFIPIKISLETWVAVLAQEIAQESKEWGRHIQLRDLRLFKQTDVSIDPDETLQSRALQWLHEPPPDSQLEDDDGLYAIFEHGPHAVRDSKLDILIVDTEVLEMVDGLGDPYDVYNRKVNKALNRNFDSLSSLPSPSEAVMDAQRLAEVFGGAEPRIHVGRPGGAPAVIFNPVLAALQQTLNDLGQVEIFENDVSLAASFILACVEFYDSDEQRQDALRDLLDSAMRMPGYWGESFDFGAHTEAVKLDCAWWYHGFLVLALVLKDCLGLQGDASSQAILEYSKIISHDKYKPFRPYCNFPSILIGVTGNRLEIAAAVCVGPIYVTRLLTLDLSLGFHASDNILRLARVFKALSRHQIELEKYYQSVKALSSAKLSCLFPNPVSVDPSQPVPKLTYREFLSRAGRPVPDILDLGNTTTAMYTATLDDTDEVIVKFTTRYNEAAHRLLAEARLAPKLHFCGRVVGDLYMIVMERVAGTSAWQLEMDKRPIPEVVATKVEEAVGLLHAQDIVFGDLRSNNVLYDVSGGEGRAVLVDFDWAGKDGEARYPATLNHVVDDELWHPDVSPHCIMKKAHDLWHLEKLKGLCKSNTGD
ncbi:hypothetical protein CVT26_005255 [Gymnopilus dilepis]|uniref:Protein kinase domain-containing protein n=1 Tax=Gymnopilus dilepis TaxID=231916 RepID=A0A409YVK8_9AGAR|nr:hypothetical protein CVT26_005255 [Gymnopilus dilepis]